MRRFSERNQLHTLSELNITPLLDLAFVLLIIFMITTPLMENSTDLVLPSGDATSAPPDREAVRTVSIQGDEKITFDSQPVTLEQLAGRIAEVRALKPELGILIRPHRDLPVQKFSEVLDAVRRSGVKRIGFVQTPKEG